MKKLFSELYKGIFSENPVLRILLGLCSAMAVTTSFVNGLGMGIAASFVLICSNVMIALLRNIIPEKIRIPMMIIVIATFTTIIDLCMSAYTPELSKSLGIFIPLIVVNCIIFGRAEAFASKNTVSASFFDGVTKGIGYTLTIMLIGFIREMSGKFVMIMLLPPGAFLLIGFLIGLMNLMQKWQERELKPSQA
jgi:Na+-translocating ferredoxin:NAD+ oxidoreductase subunit E